MGGPVRSGREAFEALEEGIEIIRRFWSGERTIAFEGRLLGEGAPSGAAAVHPIGIWLGVGKPRSLALTGRVADGWVPSLGWATPTWFPSWRATSTRSRRTSPERDPPRLQHLRDDRRRTGARPRGRAARALGRDADQLRRRARLRHVHLLAGRRAGGPAGAVRDRGRCRFAAATLRTMPAFRSLSGRRLVVLVALAVLSLLVVAMVAVRVNHGLRHLFESGLEPLPRMDPPRACAGRLRRREARAGRRLARRVRRTVAALLPERAVPDDGHEVPPRTGRSAPLVRRLADGPGRLHRPGARAHLPLSRPLGRPHALRCHPGLGRSLGRAGAELGRSLPGPLPTLQLVGRVHRPGSFSATSPRASRIR